MNVNTSLLNLIELSYGAPEKSRFLNFAVTNEQLEKAADAGEEILQRAPSFPGACTYLAAIWTGVLREAFSLPAYCVAGDLCVRGRMAFGSTDPDTASRLGVSSDGWDAHCWLALGQHVGDLSIFRTAYALPQGSNLRQAVLDVFGPGLGLFLMPNSNALAAGFEYRPKHVATEAEITAIVQGARAAGKLWW